MAEDDVVPVAETKGKMPLLVFFKDMRYDSNFIVVYDLNCIFSVLVLLTSMMIIVLCYM